MRSLLAYSKEGAVEEKLTLRIRADGNGDIYVPTAWYSTDGIQECGYEWRVKVDWWGWTNYSWLWSSSWKVRVWYGLSPLSVHTITITPRYDEYGWLRAFWYKGTDIASSLINIISDKSYKGYANSEVDAGNYYKAYQYYWCTDLINTDEELLPDTLEIIGDYYRYYEYAWCTSLISNAEERILKTVKVIWDYYRAYQYQNCTSINKINMRAINWASVWNNYRYNQYSGIATDKKTANIYIEWWIEEGWDWWLVDTNVKGVYVYAGLVNDYKIKLSWITSSKIQKNPEWDNLEYEFIEYIWIADSSGKIRIPVGGYSTSFVQNCAYDWMVSIDGGEAEEINGIGSATYVSVGSGLVEGSEHRVIIKPKTISWWWGRAFGFHTTWAQAYIKELIHDSYKCFASSRISTGAHYKHWTFTGCTNLVNSYEKLPTSVTTIGESYMSECYAWCTWLKNAFWEILHKGCSVGSDYRYHQYVGCTALEIHQWICGYVWDTYPTNYKYEYLSWSGNSMEVYITRDEKLASGLTNSMWISSSNLDKIYCEISKLYEYQSSSYWSNLSSESNWWVYFYPYVCREAIDINRYTKLVGSKELTKSGKNSSNDFWSLGWHIALTKWDKPSKLMINGWRDTMNYQGAYLFEYDLSTPWSLSSTPVKWSRVVDSVREGDGNIPDQLYMMGAYDRWGNKYYVYQYDGSSYDWNGYNFNGKQVSMHSWAWNRNNAVQISKDGRYVFGFYGSYQRFTANSIPGTNFSGEWIGALNGSVMFSDDGLTMYKSNDANTEIRQYKLNKPRDTNWAVDTGKSLQLDGCFDLSGDGRWLVRLYNGVIYWYTYE